MSILTSKLNVTILRRWVNRPWECHSQHGVVADSGAIEGSPKNFCSVALPIRSRNFPGRELQCLKQSGPVSLAHRIGRRTTSRPHHRSRTGPGACVCGQFSRFHDLLEVYVPADAYQDHVDRKAHPFNAEHVDYRSPSGLLMRQNPLALPVPQSRAIRGVQGRVAAGPVVGPRESHLPMPPKRPRRGMGQRAHPHRKGPPSARAAPSS